MIGSEFVLGVLGPLAMFVAFMAVPLLGLSLMAMIGGRER